MNQKHQLAIAEAIKPPARKSEIIEAMAIRKREQMIAQNEADKKTLAGLRVQFQTIAAEEIAKGGKIAASEYGDTYDYNANERDGRIDIGTITCRMRVEPSPELREIGRRIYRLKKQIFHSPPSLHEVRQDVRISVNQHTPPNQRVSLLLKSPESLKAIDAALEKIGTGNAAIPV